jgi:hypothetical protein
MTDFFAIAVGNLLSPAILFFILGFAAGTLKSDLHIPEQIGKGMALYLMLAIGFKGGVAMASDAADGMIGSIVAGILLSFLIPFAAFTALRLTTRLDAVTAAAVSAHYGSISIVTFVTAVGFLELQGISYERYLIAVVAIMETPAIVSGLFLAQRYDQPGEGASARDGNGELLREILLNGSVVLLVGAFFIGWITGPAGMARVEPFIGPPFVGVLCLFLLDLGLIAARQLGGVGTLRPAVIAFAIYMPIVGSILGLISGLIVGLSLGGTLLLSVLAASASYIAVPAAMRIALPRANAAIYLTLSLAITFPFNVLVGIPLYFSAARWIVGE